jgi:hypothetical protein
MRLVCAGLFILAGVLGEMYFVDRLYPDVNPFEPRLSVPLIVGLMIAANYLFSERSPWVRKNGVLSYRRRDELVSQIYHGKRALELVAPDTDKNWYLLELDTGKVLCLWDNLPSGPLDFDSMNPEVRRFPCTEFTVFRHATEDFTAEVDCAGQVIKPVPIQLGDDYDTWVYLYLPKDGEIVPDKTFENVQAELLKAGRSVDGQHPSPTW